LDRGYAIKFEFLELGFLIYKDDGDFEKVVKAVTTCRKCGCKTKIDVG
jgi:hypothetical protein